MGLKSKLNKVLRKFNVELHGLGYLQSLSKGDFKSSELDILINKFKGQRPLIYDVGANRGLKIKEYLEAFPDSRIHAFEPYPPFFDALNTEFANNKNVKINGIGLSAKPGSLLFNVNKSIDTSSFLSSKKTGLNSDQQVQTVEQFTLPVSTIDDYAAENRHERIHVLKLDIQGSELNALKGAAMLLKEKKIDFIFSETYFIQQYEQQPLFYEIAGFLFNYGYVIQDFYYPIYGKGKLAWCDTMFVKEDLNLTD